MLMEEIEGNDSEGDKIDQGVQPHTEMINAEGGLGFVSHLQTFQNHVEDDNQSADDEGTDQDCAQECHVA